MADENANNEGGGSPDIINSFIGTIDPSTIEDSKDKKGNAQITAKMTVPGRDDPVTLYVRGDNIDPVRKKAEAGEPMFVQGSSLAKGASLGVTIIEPKEYTGTIEKLHKSGTNDYGDWAATKMAIEGMKNPKQVMLTGDDANAAVESGEGGSVTFKGAWKPAKNDESGKWYSRLTSANSLERQPTADKDAEKSAEPDM